jgi:hypothetical protein
MVNMEQELSKALYDPKETAAFTSKTAIIKLFEKKYPKQDVEAWTDRQPTLTKFAGIRKRFKRLPTLAHRKNDIISIDLAVFKDLSRYNQGYKYLMVCVDTLSRMCYGFKLKSKYPTEVVRRLKDLFAVAKPNIALYSDKGGEFSGKVFSTFLNDHNVQSWKALNEVKATLAERKILDIKRRLSKYMFYNDTKKWIDAYQNIIDGINSSVNRDLGMKPVDVVTIEDERRAFMNLYGKRIGFTPPEAPLKIDNKVRLSHLHSKFKKSYMQNYTSESFIIKKVLPREGQNLYQVQALDGEEVQGKFYKKELQPADDDNSVQVERPQKAIRRKRRRKF